MLRAKYLAQKGNSKGTMNTVSNTPSTSQRINNIKRQHKFIHQSFITFSSDITKLNKINTLICDNKNKLPSSVIGCNTVQNLNILDQNSYIQNNKQFNCK